LAGIYLRKFSITSVFHSRKAENQLRFQQHCAPAQRVYAQPSSCFIARRQTSS